MLGRPVERGWWTVSSMRGRQGGEAGGGTRLGVGSSVGGPQEPEPLEGPRHLQEGGPQGHTPGLTHHCPSRGRASQRLAHTSGAPLCRNHVALFRSFAVWAGLGRIIENHEDQDGKHRGLIASFNLGGRCEVTLLT